jgi:hypothetical protein
MAHRFSHLKRQLALGSLMLLLASVTGVPAFAADSSVPTDVEGVQATPDDGSVTLKWSPATDDTAVTGYYVYSGLASVADGGGSYTFGSVDAGASTTYSMDNLSNGLTYYFAVTAYDAAGNESEFYSQEVSSTPEASGTGDFTAPTVTKASALTSTLVEVTFSEDVVLPTPGKSAFSMEASDGTALEVIDAYLSEDASTVFVTTSDQTEGTQYVVTASSSITDKAENPIVSGTSDLAVFDGSGAVALDTPAQAEKPEKADGTADSTDAPTPSTAEATKENELLVTFDQANPNASIEDFTIEQADDATKTVEVLGVSVDDADATLVTLITAPMEPGQDYVLTTGTGVAKSSVEFTAKTLDLADLIAPEDITNLLSKLASETSVLLTWTSSVDSAGDLANYLVYTSTDAGKSFGKGVKVDKADKKTTVSDLKAGDSYTFKVTAVDENGNESEGVLTTIELPEAGPEIFLLGLMSLAGAGVAQRRRRRDEV